MAGTEALPELDAYEVLAPIAQGGMATVYLARLREHPDKLVALKILRPELCVGRGASAEGATEFVAMFLDEARIASRFAHAHIATIHGLGHDRGHYFLAMELLRGRTLLEVVDEALRRGGAMPFEVVAWVGARIAEALDYVHELRDESGASREIVHRDVTPSNVFLTNDGDPKLIDFGLAKARDRIASTSHGILKGKLAYLAPEQVAGAPSDRRSDVFSLAVTLWEVSVGDRLFRADDDVETVRRVARAEVPDPRSKVPGYPDALAEALLRALARAPEDRTKTAKVFAAELDAAVKAIGRGVSAPVVGALVSELFPAAAARPWERLADELSPPASRSAALAGGSIVRAWDESGKKMTWMAVAVDEPSERDVTGGVPPDRESTRLTTLSKTPPSNLRSAVDEALAERAQALKPSDEPARARLLLERAIVDDALGDGARAEELAAASAKANPSAAAFAFSRRLAARAARGRGGDAALSAIATLVRLLDAELERTDEARSKADLLGERGRLLSAKEDWAGARASFERALEIHPNHAASLKGLETALRHLPGARAHLADHLARMADAYAPEPRLAAWLLVERARVFDRDLARPDDARAAMARALTLDGGLGPVRRAATDMATEHHDGALLVELLSAEAELERSPDRAAALELFAAGTARHVLREPARAAQLLERARKRSVTSPLQKRIVLDEVVLVEESLGHFVEALGARRERLTLIKDPAERSVELRLLAALEESLGDVDRAVLSLSEARRGAPGDVTVSAALARLLEKKGDVERLLELHAHDAATSMDGGQRTASALMAARLAETKGQLDRAAEFYRTALSASADCLEALDALDRLSRRTRPESTLDEVRARVALHRHAAENVTDVERRVAHLTAVATLFEEIAGDVAAALSTYQSILALTPRRMVALIGVERCARRLGDAGRAAESLLEQAVVAADVGDANALRLRAAELLKERDPTRALQLVDAILASSSSGPDAHALRARLLERSETWHLAADEHRRLIELATDDGERVDRLLALAELLRTRLGRRSQAIECVRQALVVDAKESRALAMLVVLLDELEDPREAERGLLALADGVDGELRARVLWKAAGRAEFGSSSDASAIGALHRMADENPSETWLVERQRRLALRLARGGDAEPLRRFTNPDALPAHSLDECFADRDMGREVALDLSARLIELAPPAPWALRTVEVLAERYGEPGLLRRVLSAQAETFSVKSARLGALWEQIRLADWLVGHDIRGTLELVLALAPDDRAALDAVVERSGAALRDGDLGARGPMALALRDLASTKDEHRRFASLLELGLSLFCGAMSAVGQKEALKEVRLALRQDRSSAAAAAATAWIGETVEDVRAAVEGAVALAEQSHGTARAAGFLRRAALLLASKDAPGGRSERLAQAAELLERSLLTEPDSVQAILALVSARAEAGEAGRLEPILSDVLARARTHDAIAAAGTALAQALGKEPTTRLTAIDALRRVVQSKPDDGVALRLLADLLMAAGARADATSVLDKLAADGRDSPVRMKALFDLAAIHRQAGAMGEVERALSTIVDMDPLSAPALRELVALRKEANPNAAELMPLLSRLAEAAPTEEEKASALMELAERRAASGDGAGAERDMIEATAVSPTAARLARVIDLAAHDRGAEARLLSALVARGEQLGRPNAPAWAALGALEVDMGKAVEGVAHLKRALALEPSMPEARAALGRGLVGLGNGEEAAKTLFAMMSPDAAPLLSLREPGALLASFEAALARAGRRDESVVARELRAVAGALDDGAHVELRARRRGVVLAPGEGERILGVAIPEEGRELLALAGALAGLEAKLVRSDAAALEINAKKKLPASHALPVIAQWLARLFGLDAPPVVSTERLTSVRVLAIDGELWLGVPPALAAKPEPEQVASLARPMVRMALAVPYVDELLADELSALLVATAERAAPGSMAAVRGIDEALLGEFSQRLTRLVGRRQKKALVDLAGRVPPLAASSGELLLRTVAQAELRAAFVVTGDLLATLDSLKASNAGLRREMDAAGPRALAAVLTHPLAGDLVRAALNPVTTAARVRLGTLWTGGSLAPPRR